MSQVLARWVGHVTCLRGDLVGIRMDRVGEDTDENANPRQTQEIVFDRLSFTPADWRHISPGAVVEWIVWEDHGRSASRVRLYDQSVVTMASTIAAAAWARPRLK